LTGLDLISLFRDILIFDIQLASLSKFDNNQHYHASHLCLFPSIFFADYIAIYAVKIFERCRLRVLCTGNMEIQSRSRYE
jgi:hypothetical protein